MEAMPSQPSHATHTLTLKEEDHETTLVTLW